MTHVTDNLSFQHSKSKIFYGWIFSDGIDNQRLFSLGMFIVILRLLKTPSHQHVVQVSMTTMEIALQMF
jgi:hypothetical protein